MNIFGGFSKKNRQLPTVRHSSELAIDIRNIFSLETAVPDELRQSIEQNANGPRKASGDSGSIEQHSLKDQTEADRYLASKQATQGKGLGVRVGKMKASGA